MTKIWRVIIVVLLAAAVVVAFNLKADDKGKAPADTEIVQEAAAPPDAENPESAKPDADAVKPAAESAAAESETAATKADEPVKKPDTDKPAKVSTPAKPKVLPRIVDIGGESCIPCKMMVPILDELRSEYKGKLEVIMIVKEKDPGALKRYRTSTIPTQILYDADGREVARHFGFWAKDDILAAFRQHGIAL